MSAKPSAPERQRCPRISTIDAFDHAEAPRLFEGEVAGPGRHPHYDEELAYWKRLVVEMQQRGGDQRSRASWPDPQFHIPIAQATRNTAIVRIVENTWDLRYKSHLCMQMLERARDVRAAVERMSTRTSSKACAPAIPSGRGRCRPTSAPDRKPAAHRGAGGNGAARERLAAKREEIRPSRRQRRQMTARNGTRPGRSPRPPRTISEFASTAGRSSGMHREAGSTLNRGAVTPLKPDVPSPSPTA